MKCIRCGHEMEMPTFYEKGTYHHCWKCGLQICRLPRFRHIDWGRKGKICQYPYEDGWFPCGEKEYMIKLKGAALMPEKVALLLEFGIMRDDHPNWLFCGRKESR